MSKKPDRRPALGRGLSALIPERPAAAAAPSAEPAGPPPAPAAPEPPRGTAREVDIDLIDPNPAQPRTHFDEAKLLELAESITAAGLVQPIVVRRKGDRFEIVAGERRWRASQLAGLLKVPVHISDVSDERLLRAALIENIQRENLNPIEEALAYRQLGEQEGLTQDEIATAVGKDRATVANYLRLLKLPDSVRGRVAAGELSMGHARALLAIDDPARLEQAAAQVVEKALSVRATEALARKVSRPAEEPAESTEPPKDVHTRQAEEKLRVALGTRVTIHRKGGGGWVQIDFANEDQLIRLYELLVEK